MKKVILIFLLIITTTSCQDEFCLDNTTPNLIIRFYNKDTNTDTKSIDLIALADGLDTLFDGSAIDSLYIPLDTNSTSVTYHFSILDSLDSNETMVINYSVEDIYVSKACGFKSTFKNFTYTITNNDWLSDSAQIETDIINENQAHVKIFH